MERKDVEQMKVKGADWFYSLGEEITHCVTHGIGAALSIAGLCVLVTLAAMQGDPWRIVSFSIYGASLVVLYLASALYHEIPPGRIKMFFRKLDHSAIFLLIAGTYTPFMLVMLRGTLGWVIFSVVWALAAVGITMKVAFKSHNEVLSLLLYLGMGWIGVCAGKPGLSMIPAWGLGWLAIGGLAYTFGVIFYACRRIPYNHAIWHVFVLAGSVCHFISIAWFVLPPK